MEEINEYLAGNLCRCTGYVSQLRAIELWMKREVKAWRGRRTAGGHQPIRKKDYRALVTGQPVYTGGSGSQGLSCGQAAALPPTPARWWTPLTSAGPSWCPAAWRADLAGCAEDPLHPGRGRAIRRAPHDRCYP